MSQEVAYTLNKYTEIRTPVHGRACVYIQGQKLTENKPSRYDLLVHACGQPYLSEKVIYPNAALP